MPARFSAFSAYRVSEPDNALEVPSMKQSNRASFHCLLGKKLKFSNFIFDVLDNWIEPVSQSGEVCITIGKVEGQAQPLPAYAPLNSFLFFIGGRVMPTCR
jgi:hypothetical protein